MWLDNSQETFLLNVCDLIWCTGVIRASARGEIISEEKMEAHGRRVEVELEIKVNELKILSVYERPSINR